MRIVKLAVLAAVAIGSIGVGWADEVLYRKSGGAIQDGASGQISKLQAAINTALQACGKVGSIGEDGQFGQGTKRAVQALAECEGIKRRVTDIGSVRQGAVTRELWIALLPGLPPPTVAERTVALLLAFEATDYNQAEWNFCQNRPFYDPGRGVSRCISNDKRSYLTWGPNGATAGWGQEILGIAVLVDRANPELVDRSFGAESAALRKAATLDNSSDNSDLERFLCGVWVDPARRASWKAGFRSFGEQPTVRQTYDRFYRSSSYDGGKIAVFYQAWARAGLRPTEVDFGYFVDRAAHTSPREDAIYAALANAQAVSRRPLTAAEARRAVSLAVLPGNPDQRKDRLGRDVTFYSDQLASRLTTNERLAWADRGERRASDVGLSDDRLAPEFRAEPPINWRPSIPGRLTPAERLACPEAVLNPQSPVVR